MKHILVVRGDDTSPSFTRTDRFGKRWIKHRLDSQPLRAIVPAVVAELNSNNGSAGVTMSSARRASAFKDPDAASIPAGAHVMVIAPMDDEGLNADLAAVRLWGVIHWSDPSRPPVLADKVRQKKIGQWISEYFTDEELKSWSAPRGTMKTELWVRPQWNLLTMFPALFGKKIVDDVKEPVVAVVAPAAEEKPSIIDISKVHVKHSPRTGWRLFGLDGSEVSRNFPTKADAEVAMSEYLASHGFCQPQ